MSIQTNELSIARFAAWVDSQRKLAFGRYRASLHKHLTAQHRDHLTQRAILDVAEALFQDALEKIYEQPFDSRGVNVERGWSALSLRVLAPFEGFCESLLDEALRFNRSSCAISNFADEHVPSAEYHAEIRRELASAWRGFALTVNDLLVETRLDHAA